MVFCYIENIQGVNNINEILEVDFDGVFIGFLDLSQSMGFLGQLEHSEVKAAILKVVEKSVNAGKIVGIPVGDKEIIKTFYNIGVRFFAVNIIKILANAGRDCLMSFRNIK